VKLDDFVKSRHSGESRIDPGAGAGVRDIFEPFKIRDSGFSGMARKGIQVRRSDEVAMQYRRWIFTKPSTFPRCKFGKSLGQRNE
jgi:hypothetical protein